jgi:hypothetical protein
MKIIDFVNIITTAFSYIKLASIFFQIYFSTFVQRSMSYHTDDSENFGYLYALKSDNLSTNQFVLGFTSNLKSRLQVHSCGHSNARFVKVVPNVGYINTTYSSLSLSNQTVDISSQLDYIHYRFDALIKLLEPYLVQDNIVECPFETISTIFDIVQSLLPVEIMGVLLDVQVEVSMEEYYVQKNFMDKSIDEISLESNCIQQPYIKFVTYQQNKNQDKLNSKLSYMNDDVDIIKQYCLINNKYKQYVKRLHSEYTFTQKRFLFYQELVDQCYDDVMKYRNEIKNMETRFQQKEEQWNKLCASINAQNYSIQDRNDELICQNNQLIDSNADLKNEIARLQNDLISNVNINTNELNEMSTQISDLLHEVQSYSSKFNNLQTQYNQLQDEYKQCQDQVKIAQDINFNWMTKYNALHDQYEMYKNQLTDARNQMYDMLTDTNE